MAKLADIKWVHDKFNSHQGEWLTKDVVEEYQKRAKGIQNTSEECIGERRKLCWELIEKYGITEIEAINIINGRYAMDYVNKYERVRERKPIERIARKEMDPADEGER